MKTILFDTEKNIPISEMRDGYYLVDGERPKLPPNVIELEVELTPKPTPTATEVFVRYGDRYVQCWVEASGSGWHKPNRPIRLTFFRTIWTSLFLKKVEATEMLNTTGVNPHPEITLLFQLFSQLADHVVFDNEYVHIYLEELYDEHRDLIESVGGVVKRL